MYMEGYVSAAEYICELIFTKRSEFKNEGRLPENFWNDAKYKRVYTGQIIHINRLLKMYSPKAIIEALKEIKVCFSITNKKLLPMIVEKQKEIDKTRKELFLKEIDNEKPSPAFGVSKNILGDL